ncbi:cadherin domain-containing protein [Tenacibaculum sp. FZY0031]|uniref:cadherin domain-containing protein n=1 Tax=Tenacibaculum sp. FZY0031 TaxID=3116648 RepID=UPI002EC6F559|nr:cadherin domain-containing protein [Tenacibaculum sp. FZY0031]
MKNVIKFTQTLLLLVLIIAYGCSKDDNPIVINLQNLEVAIDENPSVGQVIGTVESDNNASLTFSITSQTPNGALEINENTGELTVADATLFDFETNPTITATVAADKAQNTATVTITVTNTNELSVQDYTTTVDENPTNGHSLGIVQASGDATLGFSIASQTPVGALSIDASTGELTVADAALFDYEINPVITASISVDNSGNTQTLTATINLEDQHEIGEYKFGGVIFWVNASGDEGMVCAVSDQSTGIQWWNGTNVSTGATALEIGTGQANTTAIVNVQGVGSYAAQICNDLSLNNYDDWFLPSIDELEEMYNNKEIINETSLQNSGTAIEETAFWSSAYWSSTESSDGVARILRFSDGYNSFFSKGINNLNVRAVRAWTDF